MICSLLALYSSALNRCWQSSAVARRVVPGCLLVLCFAAQQCAAQDFISWKHDLESAKRTAAEADKLVLIHFAAAWCAPCKELDRFVFSNPQTVRMLSTEIIPMYVDVDKSPEVAAKFGIDSIPADVIITPAGHIIANRPSPRSTDGYVTMVNSAIQRNRALDPNVASEIEELREAARESGPPTQPFKKTDLEFRVENWHAKIDHTKTVSGGDFVPPAVQAPSIQQTSKWQAPNTFNQKQASRIGMASNHSITNPALQPASNGPLQPATGSGQNVMANPPSRIVNQFAQQKLQRSAAENLRPTTESRANTEFRADEARQQAAIDPGAFRGESGKPDTTQAPTKMGPAAGEKTEIAGMPPVGLEGYCPVTLINDGKWSEGDRQWGCIHRGRLYLFASKAHRDQFRMTPDMFSPVLGGSDPVIFEETGSLQSGKRELGVFYGEDTGPQIIVLFATADNHAKFKADPAKYLGAVRQAMSKLDRDRRMR